MRKFYATRKVSNGSVCVYIYAGPWFRVRAWEAPRDRAPLKLQRSVRERMRALRARITVHPPELH